MIVFHIAHVFDHIDIFKVCCSGIWWHACIHAQPCLILWDPMDCSPPGSSAHGISQARILEWVAIPFSRGYSWLRDQTQASHIAGWFFTVWARVSGDLYCHLTVYTIWMVYTVKWLTAVAVKRDHLVKAALAGFPLYHYSFPFLAALFVRKSVFSAHTCSVGHCSLPHWGQLLHELFGIFLHSTFISSLLAVHLFVHSFPQSIIYIRTGSWCIFCTLGSEPYHFILVLRQFPLCY